MWQSLKQFPIVSYKSFVKRICRFQHYARVQRVKIDSSILYTFAFLTSILIFAISNIKIYKEDLFSFLFLFFTKKFKRRDVVPLSTRQWVEPAQWSAEYIGGIMLVLRIVPRVFDMHTLKASCAFVMINRPVNRRCNMRALVWTRFHCAGTTVRLRTIHITLFWKYNPSAGIDHRTPLFLFFFPSLPLVERMFSFSVFFVGKFCSRTKILSRKLQQDNRDKR